MVEKTLEQWRYPIGHFAPQSEYSSASIHNAIAYLQTFPAVLGECVLDCTPEDHQRPYRPGGWTIRQLVHHIADSHMHAYLRCKFAYLEQHPVVKNYQEKDWAQRSPEVAITPIAASLHIIEGVHARWVDFFKQLSPKEFKRTYQHPEREAPYSLAEVSCFYAWHAEHHLAHIENYLKSRA